MSTKQKTVRFVMGPATARYPKLDQPYYYDQPTKRSVPDPTGKAKGSALSTEVVMAEQDAAPFIEKIRKVAEDFGLDLDEVKNWPYSKEKDKETKKATGNVIFKFKKYATTRDGSVNTVLFVDSQVKPLKNFRLTSGSTIKVNGYFAPFKEVGGGVTLRLDSVQVLAYAERAGSTEGFAAEDDGYTADEEVNNTEFEIAETKQASNEDPSEF